MKIKLLSSALEDLYDGRLFYEKQGEGLGEYFYNSLFSDIDSMTLHAGIHPKFFGYTVCCPKDSRMPFITN
jgi:hypothetical protein